MGTEEQLLLGLEVLEVFEVVEVVKGQMLRRDHVVLDAVEGEVRIDHGHGHQVAIDITISVPDVMDVVPGAPTSAWAPRSRMRAASPAGPPITARGPSCGPSCGPANIGPANIGPANIGPTTTKIRERSTPARSTTDAPH